MEGKHEKNKKSTLEEGNTSTNKTEEKVVVFKRVQDTRKQIENLKMELDKLISTGIQKPNESIKKLDNTTLGDKENVITANSPVQILKSYDIARNKPTASTDNAVGVQKNRKSTTQIDVKASKQNGSNENISPKKVKTYNVNETREYMKKQKEKRSLFMKSQKKDNVNSAELKKQKLQELHKKSLQLVTKNVEAKRERSKSRDRGDILRIDKTARQRSLSREPPLASSSRNLISQKNTAERSKSCDKLSTVNQNNVKQKSTRNTNLLYPPHPIQNPTGRNVTTNGISSKRGGDVSEKAVKGRNSRTGQELKEDIKSKTDKNMNEAISNVEGNVKVLLKETSSFASDIPQHVSAKDIETETTHSKDKILPNGVNKRNESIDVSNSFRPPLENITIRSFNGDKDTVKNDLDKSFMNKITLRSASDSLKPDGLEGLKLQEKVVIKPSESKHSNLHVALQMYEKDLQESRVDQAKQKEFPSWLQERSPQPYPHNFINTVKRKLQFAVNTPKTKVDVGIQSSLMTTTPENNPKTKEEIRELLQKSAKNSKHTDLKSFVSHKCLNLDPKSIEHLGLVPKKSNGTRRSTASKTGTESESDTSKNIPDISSESGTSLKRNAESVKQSRVTKNAQNVLKINTDRLDGMRLKPHKTEKVTNPAGSKLSGDARIVTNNSDSIKTDIVTEKSFNNGQSNKQNIQTSSSKNLRSTSRSRLSKNLFNSKIQSYSTNFSTSSDSDDSFHEKPSESSRESIIAFNISQYTRSPELSGCSTSTSSKTTEFHSKDTSNIPEVISTQSNEASKQPQLHVKESTEKTSTSHIPTEFHNPTHNHSIRRVKDKLKKSSTSTILTKSQDHSIKSKAEKSAQSANGNIPVEIHDSVVEDVEELTAQSSSSNIPTERSGSSIIQSKTKINEIDRNIPNMENASEASNFKSLLSDLHSSQTLHVNPSLSIRSRSSTESKTSQRGLKSDSSKNQALNAGAVVPLKEPTVSLKIDNQISLKQPNLTRNITLRSGGQSSTVDKLNNTNEIHLKFEAEIHLLNDFNESLRHLSAIEKAFESLKSKNEPNFTSTRTLQNRDTQTSVITKSSSSTKISENLTADHPKSNIPSINYSRGSDVADESNLFLQNSLSRQADDSLYTGLEMSHLNQSVESSIHDRIEFSSCENISSNKFAGISLRMFEQLIKDEDVRLENLKTILKIREQALLDRTKSELAYLEIQRKHLKETGKLHEASLIKKKQRGILLKHQQERHEMQRLKQMQKAASNERKIILKRQRNLIKDQLSTCNMLSKIKVHTPREQRERRHAGPLRVIQSQSESIRSETSISRRSSQGEEILSVTSHSHSVVSRVSELETNMDVGDIPMRSTNRNSEVPIAHMKRTLLMREAALQKRRKAAEELLQWHRKLLEEEKRITQLEQSANKIISQIPNSMPNVTSGDDVTEKYKFKGKQLNQLWQSLTGSNDKKFAESKTYPMSQVALERFCKSAKEYSSKTKRLLTKVDTFSGVNSTFTEAKTDGSISELSDIFSQNIPDKQTSHSVSVKTSTEKSRPSATSQKFTDNDLSRRTSTENIPTVNEYTSEFDVDSTVETNEMGDVDHISQLIDNFSKIKDEISLISQKSKKSLEDQTVEEIDLDETEDVSTDQEPSMIQTDKVPPEIVEVTEKSFTQDENSERSIKLSDVKSVETEKVAAEVSGNKAPEENVTIRSATEISGGDTDKSTTEEEIPSDEQLSADEKNYVLEEQEEIQSNLDSSKTQTVESHTVLVSVADEESGKGTEVFEEVPSEKLINLDSNDSVQSVSESIQSAEEVVSEKQDISNVEVSLKIQESEDESEVVEVNETEGLADEKELPLLVVVESPPVEEEKISTEVSHVQTENDSNSTGNYLSEFSYGIVERRESTSPEKDVNEEETTTGDDVVQSESINKSNEKTEIETETEKSVSVLDNKEVNSFEEKEQDSLSSSSTSVVSQPRSSSEKENLLEVREDASQKSTTDKSKSSSESEKNSSKSGGTIDVKKRVSEILADASQLSRGDKSPRLQDLYVTTYDVVSPTTSPEPGSPQQESPNHATTSKSVFGSEAEELLKKQLAIEQEIKQLEQQQKEQIPYVFMREIPNKPPPPYTPPSSLSSSTLVTVLPSNVEEIDEITKYSAKILHKAYLSKNLENISISENTLNLITKNIGKECYKFVFDLCKEIAREHYKQFEKETGPSWIKVTKKPQLATVKPLDVNGLDKFMNRKLKELFGFKKTEVCENAIIKWSKKKRDHVDEILVLESQAEEAEWINYDKDELLVIDEVTNDIMKTLLTETADVFNKILSGRTYFY